MQTERGFGCALALVFVATACSGTQTGAPAPSAVASAQLNIFYLQHDVDRRTMVQWRGEFAADQLGATYVVLTTKGYVGAVTLTKLSAVDCDHCGGPLIDAAWVSPPLLPANEAMVVVGPVATNALPTWQAAMLSAPVSLPLADLKVQQWRSVQYVAGGPLGLQRLHLVQTCSHQTLSKCTDKICDQYSTAVAWEPPTDAPFAPVQSTITSQRFVPDVEDCEPPQ
jgi:hypothetical protein